MGEKFEIRLMEILLDNASEQVSYRSPWDTGEDVDYVLSPETAIYCVRKMLAEFDAVIYQP